MGAIITIFAKEYKVSNMEAETAVTSFIKPLGQCGFIGLYQPSVFQEPVNLARLLSSSQDSATDIPDDMLEATVSQSHLLPGRYENVPVAGKGTEEVAASFLWRPFPLHR